MYGTTTGNQITDDNISDFIKIYPNPFTNRLLIIDETPSEYDLTIYNSLGETITNIKEVNSKNLEIDTRDLGSGIYILRIKHKGFSTIYRHKVVRR